MTDAEPACKMSCMVAKTFTYFFPDRRTVHLQFFFSVHEKII